VAELTTLRLSKICPNPDQPRKDFDPLKLAELAESIKTYGVQEPIKVTPRDGHYMIVMGERRYRASIIAGKKEIPALVEDLDDEQVEELALIENIQREDLNIIEEARAYQRLLDRGFSVEELAGKLGFKQSWRITERTSLLRLADDFQGMVVKGHISPSQAFEMSRVSGNDQLAVFRKIRDGPLSTYEKLRAFVDGLLDTSAEGALFDIQPLTEKERAVLTSYESAMDKIGAFLNRSFKDNELLILKKVLASNRAENIAKVDLIIQHLQKIRKALVVDSLHQEALLEKTA
jgi:ParB family chromosome partitioning protein